MAIADLRDQATRRTPQQLLEHLQRFDLDLRFSAGTAGLMSQFVSIRDLSGCQLLRRYLVSMLAPLWRGGERFASARKSPAGC